jgi:hypothetical protein
MKTSPAPVSATVEIDNDQLVIRISAGSLKEALDKCDVIYGTGDDEKVVSAQEAAFKFSN